MEGVMPNYENYGQQPSISGKRKILPALCSLLLCFCLTLGETGKVAAETEVNGDITADTTWIKANNPYIVISGVTVKTGVTLTIEPGVEVRFDSNCSLTIDGTFIARGTSLESIVFTTNNPGQYWDYIHFSQGSTNAAYDVNGNYVSGSTMQYCLVEYAGGAALGSENGALRLQTAHPYVDHCTLKNNSTRGIYAWALNATLKITNSTIKNNRNTENGGGISLSQSSYPKNNLFGRSTISHCTISFNETSKNGGGVYLTGPVDCVKNDLSSNKAATGGGLFASSPGANPANGANISENSFRQNTAQKGGGLHSSSNSAIVNKNSFMSNRADSKGGGMSGSGQITWNIFSYNRAKQGSAYHTADSGSNTSPTNKLGYNCFYYNTASMETLYLGCNTIMEYNLVAHNLVTDPCPTQNIVLHEAGNRLNHNNLFSNYATYELKNNRIADVDATENWWGTAVLTEIQVKIYDRQDDPAKGVVDLDPWLMAPDPGAPCRFLPRPRYPIPSKK
jgi:hypothetical protein